MGTNGSTDRNSSQFLQDYTIIQHIQHEGLYLLTDTQSQQYLLRQFTFNDRKEYDRYLQTLERRKSQLANCRHVAPLERVLSKVEDQYCSTFYKIYALFGFTHRTLQDEIKERQAQKRPFQEKDLWSLLASCILGMSHLQKHAITHQSLRSSSILISQQGTVQVFDPLASGLQTNYDTLLTKRDTPHIYLSPQLAQSLQRESTFAHSHPYKSDIWTMGMIMLEAGLSQAQDECYRDQNTRVHWQTLQYNMHRFRQQYSEQLAALVELMLSRQEKNRHDWIELERIMKDEQSRISQPSVSLNKKQKINRIAKEKDSNQTGLANNNTHTGINNIQPRINNIQPQPNNTNPNLQTSIKNPHLQHSVPTYQSTTYHPNAIPQTLIRPERAYASSQVQNQITRSNRNSNNIGIAVTSNSFGQAIVGPTGLNHTVGYNNQIGPVYTNQTGTVYNTNGGLILSQSGPIAGLKGVVAASVIELTRPSRNVFPRNTYTTNTVIDQNLVIVSQDVSCSELDSNYNFRDSSSYFENNQDRPHTNTVERFQTNTADKFRTNTTQKYQPSKSYSNPFVPVQTHTVPFGVNQLPMQPQIRSNLINQFPIKPQRQPPNTFLQQRQPLFPQKQVLNVQQGRQPFVPVNYKQPLQIQKQPLQLHKQVVLQQKQQGVQRRNEVASTGQSGGDYVVESYKQGSEYRGYKLNGQRHGFGVFYYQDGGMYQGEWSHNKMHGRGKLYYQSGKLAYEGQWHQDQFSGNGILYNQEPQACSESIDYSNFDDIQEKWTKYQGQFQADLKHGQGILYLSNGEYFQGAFYEDLAEGEGIFHTKNGQEIRGYWQQNMLTQ